MIDSPKNATRPTGTHLKKSPNIRNDDRAKQRHSSPVKYHAGKSTSKEQNESNEAHFEHLDESGSSRFLPRIVDFGTPIVHTSETVDARDVTFLSISAIATSEAKSSFRDDMDDDMQVDDRNSVNDEEETEEDRLQRQIEESEALARQLMEEEAIASYAMSAEYLRENAYQFSSEDLAALEAAMAEEAPLSNVEEEIDFDDDDSNNLSYDALLQLGERIGDVKEERWALVANEKIQEIPTVVFTQCMAEGKDENHTEVKCLICQFPYDDQDVLRKLPCGHCFHQECNDNWMKSKDTCALCRKSIVS